MNCHRTSEYREYDTHTGAGQRHNGRLKPPESLMLSTHPNAMYTPWSELNRLYVPIEGAGRIFKGNEPRCAECGSRVDGNRCRHCGAEN